MYEQSTYQAPTTESQTSSLGLICLKMYCPCLPSGVNWKLMNHCFTVTMIGKFKSSPLFYGFPTPMSHHTPNSVVGLLLPQNQYISHLPQSQTLFHHPVFLAHLSKIQLSRSLTSHQDSFDNQYVVSPFSIPDLPSCPVRVVSCPPLSLYLYTITICVLIQLVQFGLYSKVFKTITCP